MTTGEVWLKNGVVAKYQVRIKGTVAGRDGEAERDLTTTIEIKNVGSTKVEVPEGAKKKLGGQPGNFTLSSTANVQNVRLCRVLSRAPRFPG